MKKEKAKFQNSVADFIPQDEPVEKSSEGELFKNKTEVLAVPKEVTAVIEKPRAGRKLEPEIFEVEKVSLKPVKPSSVNKDVTEAKKQNTISLATIGYQPNENEQFKSDDQFSVKKEKKLKKEKAEFHKSVADFIQREEPVEKSSDCELFKT